MKRKLIDLFLFVVFGVSIPVLLVALFGFFYGLLHHNTEDLLAGMCSIAVMLIIDYFIIKRLNRGGYLEKK